MATPGRGHGTQSCSLYEIIIHTPWETIRMVFIAFIAFACLPILSVDNPSGETISIQLQQPTGKNGKSSFTVTGLSADNLKALTSANLKPEQWTALFSVHVDNEKKNDKNQLPPILGSYRIESHTLIFEPRFPLSPGVSYRAVFEPGRLPKPNPPAPFPKREGGEVRGKDAKAIVARFTIPKPHSEPTTKIEHVYPTSDVLPENQLKFYIHFSAPMSKGEAYQHIHLFCAGEPSRVSDRREVGLPFLRLEEELWNRDQTRFTLFFDPGRIKRGLRPREEVGPALEEGKSYTLVIDRDWIDAEGNPLKESFRKSFRAAPPDDNPIDPKTWKLTPPRPNPPAPFPKREGGFRDPLQVTFPKPLDHALLERVLSVTDSKGREIEGTIAITEKETRWSFTPKQPWQPGSYYLTADTALEDLAGNSIGRPFEIDVFHPIQRQLKSETVRIPFEVSIKE
jgi:hypothetical protein